MGFQAKVSAGISGQLTGAPDVGTSKYVFDETTDINLALGTGANQANNIFTDTRTLAASATETLDLAGGLTSALGVTLTFTAIKAIKIHAAAANTNNVVVGGGSNPFIGPFVDPTDKLSIPPGGMLLLANPSAAGWAVTASTGDLILVANSSSGTGVDYTVTIVGEA